MFFVNKGKDLTSKPIQLATDALQNSSLAVNIVSEETDARAFVLGDDVWDARYAILESFGVLDPRCYDCYKFSTITSALKGRLSKLSPPDAPGINSLIDRSNELTPMKRKWSMDDDADDLHTIKRSKEDTLISAPETPSGERPRRQKGTTQPPRTQRNELLLTTRLSKMRAQDGLKLSRFGTPVSQDTGHAAGHHNGRPTVQDESGQNAEVRDRGSRTREQPENAGTDDRERVLKMLKEFTDIYHIQGEQFRRKAYESAFQYIDLNPNADVRHDSKIGSAVRQKIVELLTTGKCQKLEYLKRDPMLKGKRELLQVFGVGLGGVEKLLSKGIVSVKDLRKAAASGKVVLDSRQEVGLRHYEDFGLRIPRWEVEAIGKVVEYVVVTHLNMRADVEICGSYRRGAKDCGDADVLIFSRETEKCRGIYALVDALKKLNFVHETLLISVNPDLIQTYMGVCRISHELSSVIQDLLVESMPDVRRESDSGQDNQHQIKDLPFRRLDLKLYPYHMKPFALIQWTGGEYFNRALKIRATSLGYRLSEKGLFPIAPRTKEKLGPSVILHSEKEVFEFLRIPYNPEFPWQQSVLGYGLKAWLSRAAIRSLNF